MSTEQLQKMFEDAEKRMDAKYEMYLERLAEITNRLQNLEEKESFNFKLYASPWDIRL